MANFIEDQPKQKFNRLYFWKKVLKIIIGSTIPQRLFRIYFVMIILGGVLLYLPISLQHGYIKYNWEGHPTTKYTFWDSLFISASALSTTGLSTCEISETLTIFGQVVVIFLVQVGGIGIITIFFLVWNTFRPKRRRSINQIIILQSERGNEKIAPTYRSIRISVITIFIVEFIFALIYSLWLCFYPHTYEQSVPLQQITVGGMSCDTINHLNTYHHYGKSLWQGLFCSISAINNAGFTIFHNSSSLASFRNDGNAFFTFLIICELVFGGIGYPLIFDVIEKIKYKRLKQQYKFSLFSKVALLGFIGVTVVGLACSFGFEYGYNGYSISNYHDIAHFQCTELKEFGHAEGFNKAWTIFFNTMSTRSAGFQTVEQNFLSPGSQFTFIILMFIGGSPSSTAGGIRTTTLIVIISTLVTKIMGKKDVNLFHKKIPDKTVINSLLILITAVATMAIVSIVVFYTLSSSNSSTHFTLINSFYEAASAFGTVGLSMGITSIAGPIGLIFIILLMFIGQLGVSVTLLSWTKKNPKGNLIRYPTEDIKIG